MFEKEQIKVSFEKMASKVLFVAFFCLSKFGLKILNKCLH